MGALGAYESARHLWNAQLASWKFESLMALPSMQRVAAQQNRSPVQLQTPKTQMGKYSDADLAPPAGYVPNPALFVVPDSGDWLTTDESDGLGVADPLHKRL